MESIENKETIDNIKTTENIVNTKEFAEKETILIDSKEKNPKEK